MVVKAIINAFGEKLAKPKKFPPGSKFKRRGRDIIRRCSKES